MSWYGFEAKPTIKTDEGIRAKSKRGEFVKNWWADRWIQAMERVMDRGRLQRGRRYARQGQVLSLVEEKGKVTAKVQGSRPTPYKATIELQPLAERDWERVLGVLAERPLFVAQLLAGEMPQNIEEAFAAVKLDLFPGRKELKQSCGCPDYADVCKHLAAVHYILAERFDEDPFLLFRLRGKSQDEVVAVLGAAAEAAPEGAEYAPAPPLSGSMNRFWQMGEAFNQFSLRVAAPEVAYPVLERLGEPDFVPDGSRWLAKVYDVVTETAVKLAYSEEKEAEEPE